MSTYSEVLEAIQTGKLARLSGTDAEIGVFFSGKYEAPANKRLVIRETLNGKVMRLVAYYRGTAEYWTAVPFEPSDEQLSSTEWEIV